MAEVEVCELHQNLSGYLERVKEGATLELTDRGRVVARLSPAGDDVPRAHAELAAKTGATVPTRSFADVLARRERRATPAGTTDAILAEGRADRV